MIQYYAVQLRTGNRKVEFHVDRLHSNKSILDVLKVLLKSQPVDLSEFSVIDQNAIKAGALRPGMTTQGTLVARGYPPEHGHTQPGQRHMEVLAIQMEDNFSSLRQQQGSQYHALVERNTKKAKIDITASVNIISIAP